MKLTCPYCQIVVPSEDININLAIAKCAACGHVIDVMAAMEAGSPGPEAAAVASASTASTITQPGSGRLQANRPRQFTVEDDGRRLTIAWRWFHPIALFLVPFSAVWTVMAFAMFLGGGLFATLAAADGQGPMLTLVPLLMTLLPVFFLIIGSGMIYFSVAMIVNRTTLTVDDQQLRQKHGPMPWFDNHDLTIHQIKQFYVKEQSHRTKNGRTHKSYDLWVDEAGKGTFRLVGGFSQPEDAIYLEQLLEDRLKIVDRPMLGEMRRK